MSSFSPFFCFLQYRSAFSSSYLMSFKWNRLIDHHYDSTIDLFLLYNKNQLHTFLLPQQSIALQRECPVNEKRERENYIQFD